MVKFRLWVALFGLVAGTLAFVCVSASARQKLTCIGDSIVQREYFGKWIVGVEILSSICQSEMKAVTDRTVFVFYIQKSTISQMLVYEIEGVISIFSKLSEFSKNSPTIETIYTPIETGIPRSTKSNQVSIIFRGVKTPDEFRNIVDGAQIEDGNRSTGVSLEISRSNSADRQGSDLEVEFFSEEQGQACRINRLSRTRKSDELVGEVMVFNSDQYNSLRATGMFGRSIDVSIKECISKAPYIILGVPIDSIIYNMRDWQLCPFLSGSSSMAACRFE